jgi:putative membrane protein
MISRKCVNSSILGAAVVLCLGLATSAGAGVMAQMKSRSESMDSRFVDEAASGGMAEVQLGNLAKEKGNANAVKNFGERMVTDHSKVDDELKTIAAKQGITLPSGLSKTDQAEYDRLSKLQGAEFDKEYARLMVRDHEKDIAAFEKQVNDGKDEEVKDFARQTLPTLKEHLRLAREMEHSVSSMGM